MVQEAREAERTGATTTAQRELSYHLRRVLAEITSPSWTGQPREATSSAIRAVQSDCRRVIAEA